ncbi:hypothetical protein GPUN_2876 [Glaciecola punicea ACAM 611]|jgi:beta-1,4-N-acetylglucosaminyltransferase|uniref:Glycosyl transferase family 28 C-terminal domain-containing protein n=1 Tax=Glaciecola punicea ACAM 611 TaxID=1121923 RepID=H5TF63_9ALTE|nr:PssE/Cps14G family polysaccharide biosynthesis glycosyltransferase [Glaciecola punicea]GAB56990.1 hypothetical protein GPUN_2876 [Glaciecola punicea ACAM 611]
MIKVLVSLGTTRFDGLISFFDVASDNIELLFQCPKNGMQPKHWPAIDFIDDFKSKVNDYDLVITHCGAGNVYSLLERKIKLCVVPNLERSDKHQLELAEYLTQNGLAYVLSLSSVAKSSTEGIIHEALAFEPNEYCPDKFFKTKEILDFFG